MTAFIWDLDGTLLDSYGVIAESARRTAADAGADDPEEYVLRAVKQGSVTASILSTPTGAVLPCRFWNGWAYGISSGRL